VVGTAPLVPPEVIVKQAAFLALVKVSPGIANWKPSALGDALGSSLKRNPTYTRTTRWRHRSDFRQAWRDELLNIFVGYRAGTKSRAEFESDVVVLQTNLNSQFGHLLRPTRRGYQHGFRIAHAQKSLSLLLKHAWCHGLMDEPPACPVDRTILSMTPAPEHLRTWTKVNTLEIYREQLEYLDAAAAHAGQSTAIWELMEFK
jgi:hypothetical protein